MSTIEPQTFEEAISRFKDFLRQNGYSTSLVWVEPTDLVLPGRRVIYVKVPVPSTNFDRACHRFTSGMSDGSGVALGTICELQSATCCYAWVPKDRTEQQEHLMGTGLKLSAKTDYSRIPGIPVTNSIYWQLLKVRHRKRVSMMQYLFT
jgi:hypothetical protein